MGFGEEDPDVPQRSCGPGEPLWGTQGVEPDGLYCRPATFGESALYAGGCFVAQSESGFADGDAASRPWDNREAGDALDFRGVVQSAASINPAG